MRLVLENAEEFRKCIDAIACLIDEAEFIVDESMLSLKATDPSQISMVDFRLEKNAFKGFDVEQSHRLGIDFAYLSQVMNRAKAKDELQLELAEDKSMLKVVFRGDSTRRFSVPLIDVSGSIPPSPKIDFDASVVLRAGVMQDALKDASLVSTHVTVGVNAKSFFVKAFSTKGSLDSETLKDDKNLLELNAKKACQAMYPTDYLSDIFKAAATDSRVELGLKNDSPIRASYAIGKAQLSYYLAPRIEAE